MLRRNVQLRECLMGVPTIAVCSGPIGDFGTCFDAIVEVLQCKCWWPDGALPTSILVHRTNERYPRTLVVKSGSTQAEVLIPWEGKELKIGVYQLAHEFGHVIANAWVEPFTAGPHHWIEEACCEAIAMIATASVADLWEKAEDARLQAACPELRDANGWLLRSNHHVDGSAAARAWYLSTRTKLQVADDTAYYGHLRPAAVHLHRWLSADLCRIQGLMARNRSAPPPEQSEVQHCEQWIDDCRASNFSEELPRYILTHFFGNASSN